MLKNIQGILTVSYVRYPQYDLFKASDKTATREDVIIILPLACTKDRKFYKLSEIA